MKLYIFAISGLMGISLSAYAAETTSTPATTPDAQTLQTLVTTANNSSAVLPGKTSETTTNASLSLTNETDKLSYAMGVEIGRSFKSQNLTINSTAIAQGINDSLSGNKLLMTTKDIQSTLDTFQKELIAKRQTQLAQMSDKNKREGEAFLNANKTKPGVVTQPDGLQYKVIKTGEGASPTDTDLVTVNYTGSFPDGRVFDSSYTRGKPVTFPVAEVIQGWSEALKMMKQGAIWEIYVPPALAYGDRGVGPIGPNQTLVFKIELIAVNPANSATTGAVPPNTKAVINTSSTTATSQPAKTASALPANTTQKK